MSITFIIQIISAFFGTLGFCMLFRVRKGLWLTCSVCGAMVWAVYVAMYKYTLDIFWSCFTASALGELFAELLAIKLRVPSPVMALSSVVPLIPGGDLYYAMSYLVRENKAVASWYGKRTLLYALAIAAGLSIVGAAWRMLFQKKSFTNRW